MTIATVLTRTVITLLAAVIVVADHLAEAPAPPIVQESSPPIDSCEMEYYDNALSDTSDMEFVTCIDGLIATITEEEDPRLWNDVRISIDADEDDMQVVLKASIASP